MVVGGGFAWWWFWVNTCWCVCMVVILGEYLLVGWWFIWIFVGKSVVDSLVLLVSCGDLWWVWWLDFVFCFLVFWLYFVSNNDYYVFLLFWDKIYLRWPWWWVMGRHWVFFMVVVYLRKMVMKREKETEKKREKWINKWVVLVVMWKIRDRM